MRIGMRLLLGYFLLVAVAAWFVLAIFVKEVKPGVRRATEGTLIDTATLLAELARPDLLSGDPTHGQLAQAFNQLQHRPFRANIGGIKEGANKRGNSSRLTQSFHFFMFEPIFSPVNALNQPI